jgi:hypothetical protein
MPARPAPAARPVPKPAAADPGFEVVDEPAKPKTRPKVRVIQDAETVEVPRSKAKTVRVRTVDDEDDRDDRSDDEDDRPRKNKKRRKEAAAGKPIDEETNNVIAEWVGPLFMMVLGLALTVISTWGMAKGPEAAVAPAAAVLIRVVGEVITIPITIVALMVIGSVFGIEYGTFTHAVRSLAAMGLLINGLMDILGWAGLAPFVYQPLIFAIGLGLFMTLLRLDVWEAIVTMFGLNVLTWLFHMMMIFIILMVLSKSGGKFDRDLDRDDGPKSRDRQQQKERADPGDRPWDRGGPDDDD